MARGVAIIMLADRNAFSVWVNQHFVVVKAISLARLAGTINAVPVELPGLDSRYKDVPVMGSTIECWTELYDPVRLLGACVVKEYDLDLCGMG